MPNPKGPSPIREHPHKWKKNSSFSKRISKHDSPTFRFDQTFTLVLSYINHRLDFTSRVDLRNKQYIAYWLRFYTIADMPIHHVMFGLKPLPLTRWRCNGKKKKMEKKGLARAGVIFHCQLSSARRGGNLENEALPPTVTAVKLQDWN